MRWQQGYSLIFHIQTHLRLHFPQPDESIPPHPFEVRQEPGLPTLIALGEKPRSAAGGGLPRVFRGMTVAGTKGQTGVQFIPLDQTGFRRAGGERTQCMGTEGISQPGLDKSVYHSREGKVQGGKTSHPPKHRIPHDARPVPKAILVPLNSLSSSADGLAASRTEISHPTGWAMLAGKDRPCPRPHAFPYFP